MITRPLPNLYRLHDLIERVDRGLLGVPEFQRDFLWGPSAIAELLVSVARKWPIGTLLLLEGTGGFAARPIDEAPELTVPDTLLLDGQQRLTALYHAFTDRGKEVYYVDFGPLQASGELDEDHIRYEPRIRMDRARPTQESWAKDLLAPIPVLADDLKFHEWLKYVRTPEVVDRLVALRRDELGGLKDYDVPGVVLDSTVPVAALAKIFETINRTGVRLTAFELMVARLYPSEFHLRDELDDAYEAYPLLRAFEVEGIDILRLIALQEAVAPIGGGSRRIAGVRQSDVLQLTPESVITRWSTSVRQLSVALEFLQTTCGVVSRELLPSVTMLLPLAAALDDRFLDRRADIARWYWRSSLSQAYAQGANTQAVADARRLVSALEASESLDEIAPWYGLDVSAFLEPRRRNEILLRCTLGLLVARGAKALKSGRAIREIGEAKISRIFSRSLLQSTGIDPDVVAGFCVTPRAEPETRSGLHLDDVDVEAAESQLLNVDLWREAAPNDLLRERARSLAVSVDELIERGEV